MDISLRWLREYVDVTIEPEELAHRLSMSGTEIGAVRRIGANWDPERIFVGQIVDLQKHPNADRLLLATVDYGQGRRITVVTGAPNMQVGDKVPLALVGARLRDGHTPGNPEVELKPTKLRGVMSEGMVCSGLELGLSDDHTGILILDPEVPVGEPLADVLGDVILEAEVTPNRPDEMSMVGIAREVAALTGQDLRLPPLDYPEAGPGVESLIAVDIVDPDLCARYSASAILGVAIGPSPLWMRQRLTAAGGRPISNVVDVTNYVMLELGQPLHAFDYDQIRGQRIIVRRAHPGEIMTTLDGVERKLEPDMLVIADAEGAVALAGVMGGGPSEVTENTRNILLEGANFNPVSIRRTSRGLKIPSEAARRFEKGLPADLTAMAIRRATRLILELAGGRAAVGLADAYPRPQEKRRILLRDARVQQVLGVTYPMDVTMDTLGRLGYGLTPADRRDLWADVPFFRTDVSLPDDIVEDLARIQGYDTLPTTMLSGAPPEPAVNEERRWEEVAREALVGAGYTEVIPYSWTSEARLKRLLPEGPGLAAPPDGQEAEEASRLLAEAASRLLNVTAGFVKLVNPLSPDTDTMRTSACPSLLETLAANLRHQDRDVSLFELGRIYLYQGPDALPEERRVLTLVTGAYDSGRAWGSRQEVDFFSLKGAVSALLDRMGIRRQRYVPAVHPTFHPGRAAVVVAQTGGEGVPTRGAEAGERVVGIMGEVSPAVRANFDIDERACLAALDFSQLLELATADRIYQPLARYPAVMQDLAIVLDRSIANAQVEEAIRRVGRPLVKDVSLFDVYEGAPIPAGQRSLAYHIVYQSPERTLTDAEVKAVQAKIERELAQKLGAKLRA